MRKNNEEAPGKSELILYQTEDGKTRIEVRLQDETVWMSQLAMAELFQTTVPNINIHLNNVYGEGELTETATIKDYLIVRQEGSRQVSRSVKHYNLDAIISVGYRVNSPGKSWMCLNRLVTMYLKFAELQALSRKPMYMRDWIAKLDDFLKVSGRDILTHAGKVSHEKALEKAYAEYERYQKERLKEPSPVERQFIEAVKEMKRIEKTRKGKRKV